MEFIVFERFSEYVGLCNSFWRLRKHRGLGMDGMDTFYFLFSPTLKISDDNFRIYDVPVDNQRSSVGIQGKACQNFPLSKS